MDRMEVSGTSDKGSIPLVYFKAVLAESTAFLLLYFQPMYGI